MKLTHFITIGALALGSFAMPGISFAETGTMPYGAATCDQGFVWRDAAPGDVVCVTPEARTLAAQDNAAAASRRDPNGAYGPNTCIAGFVWREAFGGDVICVTPDRRANVAAENQAGQTHLMAN